MLKTIVIEIGPDGESTVEAFGFVGPTCKVATKPYEDLLLGLGGVVETTELKSEFRQSQASPAKAKIEGKHNG